MPQFSVVVLPKLDNEEDIQRLRAKYDPWYRQISPYIPVVLPFTPATLEEVQHVGDYIGDARRRLHPLAVSLHECRESGDRLYFAVETGREELLELHRSLQGGDAGLLVLDAGYEPRLVVGRVSDPLERAAAREEASRIGRTLGVIDAVVMVRIDPDGVLKLVANYPFGVGRVDYFEKLGA